MASGQGGPAIDGGWLTPVDVLTEDPGLLEDVLLLGSALGKVEPLEDDRRVWPATDTCMAGRWPLESAAPVVARPGSMQAHGWAARREEARLMARSLAARAVVGLGAVGHASAKVGPECHPWSASRTRGLRVDAGAPAHGRRSTTMRDGLGRGFVQWTTTVGAHGGLARRSALRGTERTPGLSSGLREGSRFTVSGKNKER